MTFPFNHNNNYLYNYNYCCTNDSYAYVIAQVIKQLIS